MPKIKRQSEFQGLNQYGVFIEDRTPNSAYFNVTELGDTFTGGKNGFLLAGGKHLKQGTQVRIEILDSTGEIVYSEVADGRPEYYEGISKVVSAWVYNDTPIGTGTITILGELETYVDNVGNVQSIPEQWQGIYNIRWQKQIQINRLLPNETKVRFFRRPTLSVAEILRNIQQREVTTITQQGVLDGNPVSPETGKDWYRFRGDTDYRLVLQSGSWDRIIADNGTVTVTGLGQSYSTEIKKIVNSKTAIAKTPYYITGSNTSTSTAYEQIVTAISSGSYTASFVSESFTGPNIASSSFADITISNLETFAGDVHRVKLFRKIIGGQIESDYTLIQDTVIESNELLRDSTKTGIDSRTGTFNQTSDISNYWVSSSGNLSVTQNNDTLFQSAHLSGSNYDVSGFKFYSNSPDTFVDGSEYQLKFSAIGSGSNSTLEIYMSGSGFNNTSGSSVFPDNPYGKLIGTVSTNNNERVFVDFEENFVPDIDGAGVVNFVIYGGQFYINEISMIEFFESSFSPNEFSTVVENPAIIEQQTYKFKAEFFDINSNKIPVDVFSDKIIFTGFPAATSASVANKIDKTKAAEDITINNGAIAGGTVGGLTVTSSGMFLGTGTYGNANTPFYVDNDGSMSLSDNFTWDTDTLTIDGTIDSNGIRIGANASASVAGIFIDGDDYWYEDGRFSMGSGNIIYDGTTTTGTFTGDITFKRLYAAGESLSNGNPVYITSDTTGTSSIVKKASRSSNQSNINVGMDNNKFVLGGGYDYRIPYLGDGLQGINNYAYNLPHYFTMCRIDDNKILAIYNSGSYSGTLHGVVGRVLEFDVNDNITVGPESFSPGTLFTDPLVEETRGILVPIVTGSNSYVIAAEASENTIRFIAGEITGSTVQWGSSKSYALGNFSGSNCFVYPMSSEDIPSFGYDSADNPRTSTFHGAALAAFGPYHITFYISSSLELYTSRSAAENIDNYYFANIDGINQRSYNIYIDYDPSQRGGNERLLSMIPAGNNSFWKTYAGSNNTAVGFVALAQPLPSVGNQHFIQEVSALDAKYAALGGFQPIRNFIGERLSVANDDIDNPILYQFTGHGYNRWHSVPGYAPSGQVDILTNPEYSILIKPTDVPETGWERGRLMMTGSAFSDGYDSRDGYTDYGPYTSSLHSLVACPGRNQQMTVYQSIKSGSGVTQGILRSAGFDLSMQTLYLSGSTFFDTTGSYLNNAYIPYAPVDGHPHTPNELGTMYTLPVGLTSLNDPGKNSTIKFVVWASGSYAVMSYHPGSGSLSGSFSVSSGTSRMIIPAWDNPSTAISASAQYEKSELIEMDSNNIFVYVTDTSVHNSSPGHSIQALRWNREENIFETGLNYQIPFTFKLTSTTAMNSRSIVGKLNSYQGVIYSDTARDKDFEDNAVRNGLIMFTIDTGSLNITFNDFLQHRESKGKFGPHSYLQAVSPVSGYTLFPTSASVSQSVTSSQMFMVSKETETTITTSSFFYAGAGVYRDAYNEARIPIAVAGNNNELLVLANRGEVFISYFDSASVSVTQTTSASLNLFQTSSLYTPTVGYKSAEEYTVQPVFGSQQGNKISVIVDNTGSASTLSVRNLTYDIGSNSLTVSDPVLTVNYPDLATHPKGLQLGKSFILENGAYIFDYVSDVSQSLYEKPGRGVMVVQVGNSATTIRTPATRTYQLGWPILIDNEAYLTFGDPDHQFGAGGSSLTASLYITSTLEGGGLSKVYGVVSGSAASGSIASVIAIGSEANVFTSLVPGTAYYWNDSGSLTQAITDYKAGISVTSTKLYLTP